MSTLYSESLRAIKMDESEREQWIRECQNNDKNKYYSRWYGKNRYDYKAFLKIEPELVIAGEKSDEIRSQVTSALATSINTSCPKIPLIFYERLSAQIYANPNLRNNTRVLMKGSNAYRFYIDNEPDNLPSDMDLVIYINPDLPCKLWQNIKSDVNAITLDQMSRYKHAMDGMFCFNNPMQDCFLNNDEIFKFKNSYADLLSKIDIANGSIVSPFTDHITRNKVSRNSFIVTESKAWPDHNIQVDIPHFFRCSHLYLPRTPIYLSHNCTIRFKKDDVVGDFDLFRIKINNKRVFDNTEKWETITSDFIDISVPNINDTGLKNFWNNPKTTNVLDSVTGIWVEIPDIEAYTSDLEKMLTCYDCPESKREKRLKRLDTLKRIVGRDNSDANENKSDVGENKSESNAK